MVIIGGQWRAIPINNGIPLNSYEIKTAIPNTSNKLEINLNNNDYNSTSERYIKRITPYFYLFDCCYVNLEGALVHILIVPQDGKELSILSKDKDD